jgi:hypothetical protein
MFALNVDFTGNSLTSGTAQVTTNGQLLIGSTALPNIQVGTLTSPLGTITIGYSTPNITIDLASGGIAVEHLTGNSGGQLNPVANNFNVLGNGVSASGISTAGNIFTSGSGNTLTINSTQAQFMTNYTNVLIGASPYTVLATDYYISCTSSGGAITLKLPNAPTTNRLFIIKDLSGSASTSNISITTVGGSVNIDGQTTYKITSNYGAIQLLFNGTSYEVF